jgi:DNA-binding NarL/FixJ family response regulator
MPTSIVLADDHQVVREGIKALIAGEPALRVVAEAVDGLEVLPKIASLQPDVLVVDVMMPGLNGLEVTRQVHERSPRTRIIVLSMHANEGYVLEALRSGALGYVLKQAEGAALLDAIREVMAGRRYLSPPLSDDQLRRFEHNLRGATLDPYDTLSSREREVFQMAAEGLTSAVIGERLHISKRTVETHRANLARKLGIKTGADLVKLAVRRGLISG